MIYYVVYRNRCKYCVVETRERAENIKRALIDEANRYQVNLSVTIREVEYPTLS